MPDHSPASPILKSRGFRLLRKLAVMLVGTVLVLAGLAFLFLPGPGLVIMVVGLAVLATEFDWAKRWVRKAKDWVKAGRRRTER